MNIAGYSLTVTNENGYSVDLYDDPDFGMTSSSGFGLDAEINTTSNSPLDGSTYNNSYIPERSLGFTLQYQEGKDSELAKLRVHKVFQPRQKLTIHYISPNVNSIIYGYVEKCDTPENSHPMTTSISIICPDPFWIRGDKGEVEVELQNGECDIFYEGTIPTGFIIDMDILTSAVKIKVEYEEGSFESDNSISGGEGWVDPIKSYAPNSKVVINSITGEKDVLYYEPGSTYGQPRFTTTKIGLLYPQLIPGNNHIKITSDGTFKAKIRYTEKSGGVF